MTTQSVTWVRIFALLAIIFTGLFAWAWEREAPVAGVLFLAGLFVAGLGAKFVSEPEEEE